MHSLLEADITNAFAMISTKFLAGASYEYAITIDR